MQKVVVSDIRKPALCQELGLQVRDLRFQQQTILQPRDTAIIIRMEVHSGSMYFSVPLLFRTRIQAVQKRPAFAGKLFLRDYIFLFMVRATSKSDHLSHVDEMELLLENCLGRAEDIVNRVAEVKDLIEDSEQIIFMNLDSHRNVMMRLNVQLTMGTFSIALFGMLGTAFGMNLLSSFEESTLEQRVLF
uniref:Magnesium transporter MRS2 homolog, mitochondrial n=1 Tax=Branchiostoma floridae TaxID=7739 RepID=C3Z587_BRAFL|eukprot:XP_002595988.1 hypothetical protein BRAFLDRAFT_84062 [Branchiostoma floridae]